MRTAFGRRLALRTPLVTISPPRGNALRHIDLTAALLLIGLATLLPEWSSPKPELSFVCFGCGEAGGPDLILNVLLFLPLGLALGRRGVRPLHVLGSALALSVAIEVTQVWLPGRSSTLRDVLCNAGGSWIGAVIALRLADWLAPSRATTARLWAAVLAAVAVVAVTGWLSDYAPSEVPYFTHWSPRQAHLAHWSGRLSHAELEGRAAPWGPVADASTVRRLLSDGVELRVSGIGGDPTSSLGGIFTVSDAQMREVLLLGPDGDDLVFRLRRRAADFRLSAPEARFTHLLAASAPGEPLHVEISATVARTCARVNGREECVGRPAAGSSWGLVRAFSGIGPAARILLNLITLAVLAFPVGLFLSSVSTRQAIGSALVLTAGVAMAASASGLSLPTPHEWIGLAAGLVAGLVLNRLVTKNGTPAAPAI